MTDERKEYLTRCRVCENADRFAEIVCYYGDTGKTIQLKFCPNCGAKVDGGAENG